MNASPLVRGAVGAAALALALTACGGGGEGSNPATASPAASTAAVTDTASAQLRSGLAGLLREHVNLTAFVVQDVVTKGSLDDPQVEGSIAALGQNTDDLGDAIGSVYGDAARQKFLDLWNAHIGFFVTYTKGALGNDQKLKKQANRQLDGYRRDFGAFIDEATGGRLPKAAVAKELIGHVQTLEDAIDALVIKAPDAASKVEMAAAHMDGTAAALASGISAAKNLAGDVDGAGSGLRAGLTGLLVQHVAQTGQVIQTIVQTGSLDSPQTQGAIAALGDNTNDLGDAIGSVYGDQARGQFLDLWNAHIGFFVTYTKGDVLDKPALKKKAAKQLNGYRKDFGAFIAGATQDALTAQQVADELTGHVQTLEAAIDAIVAGDDDAAQKLYMAQMHMPGTAAALAGAIAQTNPDTFSS